MGAGKNEKVISPGMSFEYVKVTYTNDTKVSQCFYDHQRNLIEVKPRETRSWVELRSINPNSQIKVSREETLVLTEAPKEKADVPDEGKSSGTDKGGGGESGSS